MAREPIPMCAHPVACVLFSVSLFFCLFLICVTASMYGWFQGPIPTSSGVMIGALLFLSCVLSIIISVVGLLYIIYEKHRPTFFIIVLSIMVMIAVSSAFTAVSLLIFKLSAADVENYLGGFGGSDTPNFINKMQEDLRCCGGYDFRTYARKTKKPDGTFTVPVSCCWTDSVYKCNERKLLEKDKYVEINEGKEMAKRNVDLLEVLKLWKLAFSIMKRLEGKEDKDVTPLDKPFIGLDHLKVVQMLVQSNVEHKYRDKYNNNSYFMADPDATSIKVFGCGMYLEAFTEYALGHPNHHKMIVTLLVMVKTIAFLWMLIEFAKCGLFLWYGLKFQKENEGIGIGGSLAMDEKGRPRRARAAGAAMSIAGTSTVSPSGLTVQPSRKRKERPGARLRDKDNEVLSNPWGF